VSSVRTRATLVGMSEPAELLPRPFSAAPGEVEALLGALHRNRRTFAWKTGGLDVDAMRRTLGPSTVTLGGLLKHLALVEDLLLHPSVAGPRLPGRVGADGGERRVGLDVGLG